MKKYIFLGILCFCILQVAFAQINRTTIMSNANSYTDANYSWTATSGNFWLGVEKVTVHPPDTRLVYYAKPPYGCVIVGTNWGMPYKWGGNSTISEHNTAMAATPKRSAGDICYTYGNDCSQSPDWGVALIYASGMDCSGFVTRDWNIPQMGTYGLENITVSVPINASSLRPGDIYLWPGHHVKLYSDVISATSVNVIEAAKGSPVWARVTKHPQTVNSGTHELPNYTARVFVNTPSCGTRPSNIHYTGKTSTSITIDWTSTGASTYDYYYKKHSSTKYTLISGGTQKPKTITGLTPNTSYDFKVSTNCSTSNGTWGISHQTYTTSTSASFTNNDVENKSSEKRFETNCSVTTNGLEVSLDNVIHGSSYQLCNAVGGIICKGKSYDSSISCAVDVPGIYFLSIVGETGNLCVQKIFVNQ